MNQKAILYNALNFGRPIKTLDDKAIPLPRASLTGYGVGALKKNMILLDFDGMTYRSLGRITTIEGQVFILAIALVGVDMPCIRWLSPNEVAVAYKRTNVSSKAIKMFYGPCHNPIEILRQVQQGFLVDSQL